VGNLDGCLPIGPGAAAARESVYAVLVDRPSEEPMHAGCVGSREQTRGLSVHSIMFVVISINVRITVRRPI